MDTSFELVAPLSQQPTTNSPKIRPTQFVSVAGGVQKRLETNIKKRKYSRLSGFDTIRNISKFKSPNASALSDAQQKALHSKQQLEICKEEKDKKKKEAAAQKKKLFLAGVSQWKTFGSPPPIPSTSGHVPRSQARQEPEPKPSNTQAKSFAPSNATFNPSLFLNCEVPKLAPVNKKKASITFEPVLPKKLQKETRPTRTSTAKPVVNEPIVEASKPNDKTNINAKTTKNTIQKPPLLKQQVIQSSSSSSDTEQPKHRQNPSLRKSPPQEFTSQDSACALQDASTAPLVSMSSVECNLHNAAFWSLQDASDAHSACMYQETTSSQDELSTSDIKVPKSESGSEEKLRSPKLMGGMTPEQIIEEAKNISPCVTMSPVKDNARKEMKKKLVEGILDDNSNMESMNYFRRQLNSEIDRITAMCDTWDRYFAQTVLPEHIQELVLTTAGQARLLMSEKLQQFAGLVERCAEPTPGTSLVTPAHLHGFWDMVFMQVENVDMRLKKLEESRLQDWTEEQKPQVQKAAGMPSGGPGRFREMFAAATIAKTVQESQSENPGSEKLEPTASSETKTFEAGSFMASSPLTRGSAAPGTFSHNTSLLKSALSSEANESVSKQTPTIPPVNLYAVPARSIHSSSKEEKPKIVLFHDSDEPSSPTSYTSGANRESGVAPSPADDKENNEIPIPTKLRHLLSRQNAEDRP